MTGQVVTELATVDHNGVPLNGIDNENSTAQYTPVEVATMVSFSCSIWMVCI